MTLKLREVVTLAEATQFVINEVSDQITHSFLVADFKFPVAGALHDY